MEIRKVYFFALVMLAAGACCDEPVNLANSNTANWLLNAKPWYVSSVLINGRDYTPGYLETTLQFGPKTFTSVNGQWLWPETGSWKLKGTNGDMFTRLDKDIDVTITKLNEKELAISFDFPDQSFGGRSDGGVVKRVEMTFISKN